MAYEYEATITTQLKSDGHKLYNLTSGGKGATGRKAGKSTRRKLSEKLKESWNARKQLQL